MGDDRRTVRRADTHHHSNFVELANRGFYNDLIFHRVIDDFMIQGEERQMQLPNFAVFIKMEQLRPRGELILTARLDNSTGVTMSDAYKNHETITIRLKFEDGGIWEGELYSSLLRKNLLQTLSSQDTEISKTTVKLDSWQATIESTPLSQE